MQHPITTEDYQQFTRFLESVCGVMLGDGKQYLVSGRMNALLRESGVQSLGELVQRASSISGRDLRTRIVDAMSTNETSWFRDRHPFSILDESILPELLKVRKKNYLRIWSAASSSGEEAFSIAMTIDQYLRHNALFGFQNYEIIGTDVSSEKIIEARAARYSDRAISRGIDDETRARYFRRNGEQWCVLPELQAKVNFRHLNLKEFSQWAGLGKFDVVFCRNVLIYFSETLKSEILQRIANVLEPGGYLFLGASESVGRNCNDFSMQFRSPGVVYQSIR